MNTTIKQPVVPVLDLFGNHLSIGDTVGFNPPFYSGMMVGKIIKFTPKQVKIEYYDCQYRCNKTKLDYPSNVVKKV
jgi:hypothetical protein